MKTWGSKRPWGVWISWKLNLGYNGGEFIHFVTDIVKTNLNVYCSSAYLIEKLVTKLWTPPANEKRILAPVGALKSAELLKAT